MSISAKDLVWMKLCVLSITAFAVGCTGGDSPAEKEKPAVVVEATVAPTVAPTEPAAPAAEADEYEDSLVLLAEGEPDSGPVPLTVQFEVESLVVDEITGARYEWNFGDGGPVSNEANPSHTYEKPGDYTATVRVVDSNGEQGWDEVDIFVEELEE